ncbi:MAG: glycosyltransferase [Eggerthellaceae bacterium]|nr:glycosyltransferase [Eggerthellaceae bacterium]
MGKRATNDSSCIAKPAHFGQNAKALDSLIEKQAPEKAIADLAKLYWDDPAGCWDSAAGSKALACPIKEVSTIGVYQYRMGIGGAERVVAEQVRTWKALGKSVVFFADEPREACQQELPDDIAWVELPAFDRVKAHTYKKRANAIAQAVREHGVDALVHNQWWNPLIGWDAMLFKALGVPVCLVCHSVYMLMFHEANPREFDHSRIMRYLDGLVTLSEFDKRFWERFNPRIFQANNPVTIAAREEQRSTLSSNNIVWVGRISDFDKQPAEAIEIFARVALRKPEATLTIVGAASGQREIQRLRALAQKLKVDDRVSIVEPGCDVERYYREASVYLITSRLEGWSLTLAESKAFGLPCVMYELDYLTLTAGRRGILAAPQGDRDGAAKAICRLLDDDALRHRLGQEAFDHLKEIEAFDFGAFWQNVFDALAQGSPKRNGFELDDEQWNLLLEGFKESVDKALFSPVKPYAKRKLTRALRR